MEKKINKNIRRNKQAGVTAIEYGLIASLVAVMLIAGVTAVGGGLDNVFNQVAGAL